MSITPEDLYVSDVDLFQFGRLDRVSGVRSPGLINVRPGDISETTGHGGVVYVLANGDGISTLTRDRMRSSPLSGPVYRIPSGTALPGGLILAHDGHGHYAISPLYTMPKDQFVSLLRQMEPSCEYCFDKPKVKR